MNMDLSEYGGSLVLGTEEGRSETADVHCIGRSCVVSVCALRADAVMRVGPWCRLAGRDELDEKLRPLANTASACTGLLLRLVRGTALSVGANNGRDNMVGASGASWWSSEGEMCKCDSCAGVRPSVPSVRIGKRLVSDQSPF